MGKVTLRNRVNTLLMNFINIVQYPIFELLFRNTIPVYGLFQRFIFFTKRDNIGDDLNIDFFELITKRRVVKAEYSVLVKLKKRTPYSLIGSILEHTIEKPIGAIVWGSGLKYGDKKLNKENLFKHKFLAVRGPKTREILLNNGCQCPEVYGDPIILLSKYFPIKSSKKYRYGIIPHKIDRNLEVIESMSKVPGVVIVDIVNYHNWMSVVEQIISCDMIISSSLHGIIISDSYNIPNIWACFSDFIDGNGFKFNDYFEGVGKSVTCVNLSEGFNESLIELEMNKWTPPVIHPDFEKSCPLL